MLGAASLRVRLDARPRRRKDLARVRAAAGVEDRAHAPHGVEVVGREEQWHEVLLLGADSVLAADHAAGAHAELQNLGARREHAAQLVCVAAVERDVRVQIAVAGVEDVRERDAVAVADRADRLDHLGKLRARNDGVVDVEIRREAAHRAEGALARAPEALALGVDKLSPIWPSPRGDVWEHPVVGLVPFHKLSQWMSYSLVEPIEGAGLRVVALDALTGLPEYRNGGLLVDAGALRPKQRVLLERSFAPGDEAIVEWRALTVALLDQIAEHVRLHLGMDAAHLPLVKVLEAGTWFAGRRLAAARRPGGGPPIIVESDGTVF